MKIEWSVLVLGDHDTALASLAERCRRLGFRAVRAKTPADAIELSEERGFRFAAALVDPACAAADLGAALREIGRRCRSEGLIAIATGVAPIADERDRLRDAGVRHALWEPVGDHALRFHLNHAMAPAAAMLRESPRVPTDWRARVWVAGRDKRALVYSASCGGAYLATPRPSQTGAEVAVELALPDGTLTFAGRVLYTSVPGNLRRSGLPDGMAVGFNRLSSQDAAFLRSRIEDSAARFAV